MAGIIFLNVFYNNIEEIGVTDVKMMSKSLGTTGIQGMVGKTCLNRCYLTGFGNGGTKSSIEYACRVYTERY